MSTKNNNASLERRIIIGLIVSTDYIQQVIRIWKPEYLQSSIAQSLGIWCMEYYEKYEKAPHSDIEGIYIEKLRNGSISKDIAEEIEEDILPDLSEEYERVEMFNVQYLLDQTRTYFRERQLLLHSEEIKALIDQNEIEEAETKAQAFNSQTDHIEVGLELGSEQSLEDVDAAFNQTTQRVVTYPGALGEMWNDQMARGNFVALMGPEKRGKTFWLLDISMRAITKKANVAFFQAGDMTKHQQLKRICIHLARKSDKEKYCGKLTIPVKDCLLNQADLCDRPEREENDKLKGFPIRDMTNGTYEARKNLDMDTLVNFYHKYPDYIPCHNCKEWKHNGSVWLKEHNTGPELKAPEAKKVLQDFFKKYKRRFKLSTHANQTLTVKEIHNILNTWEKEDGFVPDIIVIDYADIVLPDNPRSEFRHQQNSVWMAMRGLSQEKHCLVVTATQADATSYDQDTLNLKNFSEDKRKYAHATAVYGLNQDKKGREKKMGLMRINELVVREDDFNVSNQVYVMQKLQMGRPFLGSFK